MARQEIQNVADFVRGCAIGNGHGQMLFAGAERSQLGMSCNHTSWQARIGGNGFVAGVARDSARVGMTDDASHDENGGVASKRNAANLAARRSAVESRCRARATLSTIYA